MGPRPPRRAEVVQWRARREAAFGYFQRNARMEHGAGESTSDLVGFRDTTRRCKPASPAGKRHTPAAGSPAGDVNKTFDGSTGSTAQTIGDIVQVLKTIGIPAS